MTTQEIYKLLRTETYNDRTTFGGLVSEYDFTGRLTMKQVAERMKSDERFDKFCKKKRETRNNYKRNRYMGETT